MGTDFEAYKTWVMSRVNTDNTLIKDRDTGQHVTFMTLAAMGLAGETGEVVDLLKKVIFHGKPITDELRAKLILELGDVLWYYALACKLLGVSLEIVMDRNIAKLEDRDGVHGERFKEARC